MPGCSCWLEDRELHRRDGLAPSLLTRHAQKIPRDDFFCFGVPKHKLPALGVSVQLPQAPLPQGAGVTSVLNTLARGWCSQEPAFPTQLHRASSWDHEGVRNSRLVRIFPGSLWRSSPALRAALALTSLLAWDIAPFAGITVPTGVASIRLGLGTGFLRHSMQEHPPFCTLTQPVLENWSLPAASTGCFCS